MRRLSASKLDTLERLANRALRDTGPQDRSLWLELPALPERGWTGPRIFYAGELPEEYATLLQDYVDGLPGWPSCPAVKEAITMLTGDEFEITPEELEEAFLGP